MMTLAPIITRVSETIRALLGRVAPQYLPDRGAHRLPGSGAGRAEQVLELGEHLLDRIEIGGIFRQQEQLGPGLADRGAHTLPLMCAKIVHPPQIARPQRRRQNLLDIEPEAFAIDRTVDNPGSVDAVAAQG